MDTQIDVNRLLTLVVEEICEADGALSVLGGERPDDSLELYGLANLDAHGVAEYLKNLAAKLQTVATIDPPCRPCGPNRSGS